MNFFTTPRKMFLGLHLGLLYMCYFTHRTIARRFFPEIKNEIKWTLVVLYLYILVNYLLVRFCKSGPVTIKNPPDCEALGIKHPDHIKLL
jgi:hypothetical protein